MAEYDEDFPAPAGRRVYAHVHGAELICPQCGTFARFGASRRLGGEKVYDGRTALYTCGSCGYRAYIGLVLWPVHRMESRTTITRPGDHVLTPGEATAARLGASFASAGRLGDRRARRTNIQCTCAVPCEVHTAPPPPNMRPKASSD